MKERRIYLAILLLIFLTPACSKINDVHAQYADVIKVEVRGQEDHYTFSVTIQSPDKGCNQYADWWEVISPDGRLLYRRILLHSHSNEQPFTRSGGPIEIRQDTRVIVRAHMNNTGYGGKAMQGSISDGFIETDLSVDFASDLGNADPQPSDCAF